MYNLSLLSLTILAWIANFSLLFYVLSRPFKFVIKLIIYAKQDYPDMTNATITKTGWKRAFLKLLDEEDNRY